MAMESTELDASVLMQNLSQVTSAILQVEGRGPPTHFLLVPTVNHIELLACCTGIGGGGGGVLIQRLQHRPWRFMALSHAPEVGEDTDDEDALSSCTIVHAIGVVSKMIPSTYVIQEILLGVYLLAALGFGHFSVVALSGTNIFHSDRSFHIL